MNKLQKTIDRSNKALEEQRNNPLVMAIVQTLAVPIYLSFKLQWFLSSLLFGEDACTIARNKLNSDYLNKKNNP